METALDYLTHLRTESARFLEVLRDAPADSAVPTCPDWRADDLLWHLCEVQWFWGTIVREAVTDPYSLNQPDRPSDRTGLLTFFEAATIALQKTLAETGPDEPRWTWSKDQTAGFIRRRQAHEALIHRLDAELTADVERTPLDPGLAEDGIDEALRIMFGGTPEWGRVTPDPASTLRIRTTDTGRSWRVTLGRLLGTDPDGAAHDEAVIVVAAKDTGQDTAATVSGTAADLDCWLWGRPALEALDKCGDEGVQARFQAILDHGID